MRWMALLLVAFVGNAFGAGGNAGNWERVQQLRTGRTVQVRNADQRMLKGHLVEVTADGLTLEVEGATKKVARADVAQVQVNKQARSVLIGLGIGLAAGIGTGAAVGYAEVASPAQGAAGFGAIFGAIGAGVGALLPPWKTVYRVEGR